MRGISLIIYLFPNFCLFIQCETYYSHLTHQYYFFSTKYFIIQSTIFTRNNFKQSHPIFERTKLKNHLKYNSNFYEKKSENPLMKVTTQTHNNPKNLELWRTRISG